MAKPSQRKGERWKNGKEEDGNLPENQGISMQLSDCSKTRSFATCSSEYS